MQNYIGQQIDRYRITERLGTGGMAVVYKAYDTRLKREVAIKMIRTKAFPALQHERLMKRFQREAKAQAQFNHPNIVPVYDYGVHEGMPYLVMEYIPGGTLKERITGPVSYQQAIAWVLSIADALAYAHERGIVHRDVKPSNILITQENEPILTDFGIAKVLDVNEGTLTATGMGVGTPEYMAPEQWHGQTSEATDQYALGVVLYELLTGQKPFTAETPVAIALKQMRDPLVRPSDLVPEIPEEVEKILFKTLAPNPSDRYEDIGILCDALSTLVPLNSEQKENQIENALTVKFDKAEIKNSNQDKKKVMLAIASIVILGGLLTFIFSVWGDLGKNLIINKSTQASYVEPVAGIVEIPATMTVKPTQTITATLTKTLTPTASITPTPELKQKIMYINDNYELMRVDVLSARKTKIMDIEVSEARSIPGLYYTEYFQSVWSDDGNYLVYSPKSSSKINSYSFYDKGLFLFDTKIQQVTIISDTLAEYRILGFSPDENHVLFSSTVKGIPGLFIYDIETGIMNPIAFWDGPVRGVRIEWADDDPYFYFMTYPSNILKKYNIETNALYDVSVTTAGGANELKLSPNGDKLFILGWDRLSIVNLETEENNEFKSEIPDFDYRFWKWIDNTEIIGGWVGVIDVSGHEHGIFRINANDYTITYDQEPQFDNAHNRVLLHSGKKDLFWGPDGDSFETFCLFFTELDTLKIDNQICSDNFSRFSISRDQQHLLIIDHQQVNQLNLETYEMTTLINIEDSILHFFEYWE
jgi:serine/threonine protein kinase